MVNARDSVRPSIATWSQALHEWADRTTPWAITAGTISKCVLDHQIAIVDEMHYHASASNPSTGEVLGFYMLSDTEGIGGITRESAKVFGTVHLEPCYQAAYVSFYLQRGLSDRGYGRAVDHSATGGQVGEDQSH